jgi:lambda repressor-like predicted transcriptional regulator
MDEAERTLVVRMSMLRAHLPDVARDIEHRAGVTCERLWPERFPNEASMRGAT